MLNDKQSGKEFQATRPNSNFINRKVGSGLRGHLPAGQMPQEAFDHHGR